MANRALTTVAKKRLSGKPASDKKRKTVKKAAADGHLSAGRAGASPKPKAVAARRTLKAASRVPSKSRAEGPPIVGYRTKKGVMYQGLSELVLASPLLRRKVGSVQLIFTSPPFPLHKKKRYGNFNGTAYLNWLSSFAQLLREFVVDDGSVVIEIGNAWLPGHPVMSTLPMEALLAFKEAGRFHLCQEFICLNTARLPSPAQWVTVERCRVKDAFTRLWWLGKTERPKADNRRVLTEYSEHMKRLLERGTYNPGRRPSDHVIGERSFLKNHRGSIPPNVLIPNLQSIVSELTEVLPFSNTGSSDKYQQYCRERQLPFHPARMPGRLVEFFVKFLTSKNDLVLDPFGGSNTTGYVAESLGRRWISIEPNLDYVRGSRGRFLVPRKTNR